MKKLSAQAYAEALTHAYAASPAKQRPQVIDRFIGLLRRQRASQLWPRIMAHLQQIQDRSQSITRVTITSAMPIDQQAMAKKLTTLLGKVALTVVVDPDLVGGLTIRIGDRLIDGSIRHQLNDLHTHLMTAHVQHHTAEVQ